MIDTTIMLMIASTGMMFAVTAPSNYSCQFASVFMGLIGGLMVQGWTSEKVRPTPRVMVSDVAASVFAGFASWVLGVPICLAIINKIWGMPEGAEIVFDPAKELGFVIVISGLAGMAGAGLIRRYWLPRILPDWKQGDDK